MPQTDSRKANQRRRFQKQRQESRERLAAVRAQVAGEAKPAAAKS